MHQLCCRYMVSKQRRNLASSMCSMQCRYMVCIGVGNLHQLQRRHVVFGSRGYVNELVYYMRNRILFSLRRDSMYLL